MAISFSPPKIWQKNHFKLSRRELLIIFSFLAVMMVERLFPVKSIGESFWLSAFLFFVFPVLIIKFLLKEPLENFGLIWGDKKKGLLLSIVIICLFLLINFLVVKTPLLRDQINFFPQTARSFWMFIWFEFVIFLAAHFFWELFFRGFLQFGLEKNLGAAIIPVQAALQSLTLARSSWVMVSLIFLSALAAGYVAKQSRSIIYSFVSLWIISVSLDIMIIRFLQQSIS